MPHIILYIEDENAIIQLVRDVLEHPDITLLTANSAEQGLRMVREHKPHLVILDVFMPGRNGWSVYHELRAEEQFKKLPIIMLTGQLHRYRIMKEFSNSTVDAYITKPFDARAVRNEVEAMLNTNLWGTPGKKPPEPSTPPEEKPTDPTPKKPEAPKASDDPTSKPGTTTSKPEEKNKRANLQR